MTRRALFGLRAPPAAAIAAVEALDELRSSIRAGWSGPGAEPFLGALEPAAAALTELAAVRPGDRVLDVGHGDRIERLPHPTASFDVVLSTFAAALDPAPDRAVGELVRVTAPGGRVGLAAWVPRGLPGRLPEFAERIRPLPPGAPSPREWGRNPIARARLEPWLDELDTRTRTVRLTFADPDDAFATMTAPLAFDRDELAHLRPRFDRLLASCNDGMAGVEIAGRYLIAVGRKRATA